MLPDHMARPAHLQTAGLAQHAELNSRDHVTAPASSTVWLASTQVIWEGYFWIIFEWANKLKGKDSYPDPLFFFKWKRQIFKCTWQWWYKSLRFTQTYLKATSNLVFLYNATDSPVLLCNSDCFSKILFIKLLPLSMHSYSFLSN